MVDSPAAGATDRVRIAILLGAPLTEQNFHRTGIPQLSQHFDVVVLDCNAWLRRGYAGLRYERHPFKNVVKVTSKEAFEAMIERLAPDYAVDFIGLGPITPYLQSVLRKNGTQFVVQKTGTVPSPSARNAARSALGMLSRNPAALVSRVAARWAHRRYRAVPPDVALLAGRKSLDAFTAGAGRILWIASSDYHTYRTLQHRHVARPGERSGTAVFIDDCIAQASDYALLGLKPPVAPETYFPLLCQAFDRFERASGTRVVVAAHPSGKQVEGYASHFGDRLVHFDRTAELCSSCDVVLAHFSTALSFPVLWRRPVVIMTTRELDESFQGPAVRERATQLGCPLLFAESSEELYRAAWHAATEIDEQAYLRYVDNYIVTAEAGEAAPWATFIEFVQTDRRTALGSRPRLEPTRA